MNWPLITGWFVGGIGFAIAMEIEMARSHRAKWSGVTRAIGRACLVLFWPIFMVTIVTLALMAASADR